MCQSEALGNGPMRIQYHLGTASESARQEADQIRTLIVDLDCTVQMLDCSIAAEELGAKVFDPSHVAYPPAAKAMATRRHNLNITIAALEKQLADIQAMLPKVVATAA
jgi:flagellar FliJ protein